MIKSQTLGFAVLICGGITVLGGCHHRQAGANGVPFPAPQAAPSAQVQIQQIQDDPHIPAAQKPGIEAGIARNSAPAANHAPSNGQ